MNCVLEHNIDQWGPMAIMAKIIKTIIDVPHQPITVQYLVAKYENQSEYQNQIVSARCFLSILTLEKHGYIIRAYYPNTTITRDIVLGPKFDELRVTWVFIDE